MMLSILSCAYWSFTYILGKNVSSNPSPIFNFFKCCKSYLYTLDTRSLLDTWFAKFLPICVLSLHFLDIVLWRKVLILMKSKLSIFLLVACAFCVMSKKTLHILSSWILISMFSSKSSIILAFMFRPLLYIELIFVCDMN